MRHTDAVDDFLVLYRDVIVGGIDRAWSAGRIGESNGDTDRALDAGGEIGTVEVGGVLFRGGLCFGGRLAFDDARPAALAAFQISHGVRDGGNVEDGAGEMMVETREIEAEAAALARSGICEIAQIDVGLLSEPVDGAVDAEQWRVEEIFFAGDGDARR